MNDSVIKFSGTFILQDTETEEQHSVPIQVLYSDDHHVIVMYRFTEDRMDWIEPVITGVITNFELDPNTAVAMACSCDLLGPEEVEPEDGNSWGIVFSWEDGKAVMTELRKFEGTEK